MQGTPSENDPLLGLDGTRRLLRASWSGDGGVFSLDTNSLTAQAAPFWWLFLLRGILVALFGLFCLLCPGLSIVFMALMFGYFMLLDGLACFLNLCGCKAFPRRYDYLPPVLYFINACCDVFLGVYTFVHPDVTAVVLLILVASWFIVSGVCNIILAISWRVEQGNESEWYAGVSGVFSILFGVLMIARPAEGALAFATLIGIIAIVFGLELMYVSKKLKDLNNMLELSGDGGDDAGRIAVQVSK